MTPVRTTHGHVPCSSLLEHNSQQPGYDHDDHGSCTASQLVERRKTMFKLFLPGEEGRRTSSPGSTARYSLYIKAVLFSLYAGACLYCLCELVSPCAADLSPCSRQPGVPAIEMIVLPKDRQLVLQSERRRGVRRGRRTDSPVGVLKFCPDTA